MVFTASVIAPDGIFYVNIAKMINAGSLQKISEFGFFSLYPFLIVIAQKIFHNWEIAGRMVSAVLGSLAVIPLFLITKKLINMKIALIAGIFYIISPRLVEYSTNVLRESSYWFFSITALWLALKGLSSRKLIFVVLASLFTGLAMFTRMEGVSIFLIILLWIFWYYHEGDFGLKRLIIFLLVFIVSMPIIFSSPLLFFKNRLGSWEIGHVGTKLPFLIMNSTEHTLEVKPDILDRTTVQFRSFLDISKRHKYITFISEIIYKFIKSFNVVFFILLLFGVFRRRSIPYSRREIPILIWFTILFLSSFFYVAKTNYFGTRHGLLMGIPALVWAGIGFYELRDIFYNWVMKRKSLLNYSKYMTIFLLMVVFIVILPKTLSCSGVDKIELKEAGVYLKEMGYSKARFAGEPILHRVLFYADSEFIPLPQGMTFEEVIRFLKENQTRLLIVDKRTVDTFLDNFNGNVNPFVLEKVQLPKLDQFKEYSIVVYRLKEE
ncbi:MAG: glycosyltransferase family 39 protein [Proteobacteria bacterium]|nr:glycosyltransferase family 39 protein [Pseudomonadota bacterium]